MRDLRNGEDVARRHPDWPAAAALILCLTAALALRAHFFTVSVIDWDESLYLVMAREWLAGGLPYVAVWDQHPVGLPALLMAADWLTGDLVLGARLAATLAVGLTAFVLYRFCARDVARPWAGALAALLYLLLISRIPGGAANTEVFNNLLVASAALLLLGAARGGRVWPAAVGGALLLGLGLQLKFVVFPECAAFCLAFLVCRRMGGWSLARCLGMALALMIAGLLPTAAATAYFWANGAIAPYLAANIGANAAYVTLVPGFSDILRRSVQGLKPMAAPAVVAILAVAVAVAVARLRPARMRPAITLPQVWLAIWIAAAAADVVLPLKFWPHYFHALLPPLAVAGALGAAALAGHLGRRRQAGFAALAVLLLALPARAWINEVGLVTALGAHDTPRLVAAWLTAQGVRNGDVYVYNYEPVIYALAAIRPPSRFVIPTELSDFSASNGVDGDAEVERILRAAPRFIVTATHPPTALPAATDRQVGARLRGYVLRRQWHDRTFPDGQVFVYERVTAADE
jgi:4-amino-4-deoxy-L-arabinose transferase-like glycosyltransferase